MRIILDEAQFEDCCDHIIDLVGRLRAEQRELRRRKAEDRDGYPNRSMGGERAGAVTHDFTLGRDVRAGTDTPGHDIATIPPRSDPVGELVVSSFEVGRDDVSIALEAVVRETQTARRGLESAYAKAQRAKPKPDNTVKLPTDTWCVHHERHGMAEPLGTKPRRGLCGWCEGFERTYRQLPPKKLLDARARGERITDRLIMEALDRRAS